MTIDAGAVLFVRNLAAMADFYQAVAGLTRLQEDDDHVLLAHGGFQLIVHQIPAQYLSQTPRQDQEDAPVKVREGGAVKLILSVADIDAARTAASAAGGGIYPPEKQWEFRGATVCDGVDPEGNVIQLWERG